MSNNALLGFTKENEANTDEEEDLQDRSNKRIKEGNHCFSHSSTTPLVYDGIVDVDGGNGERKSYKESITGEETVNKETTAELHGRTQNDMEDDEFSDEEDEGIKIEKAVYGGYACPSIVLSKKEEARIQKPWKNGLIVQLLGRKIGFKALESRLKQLWVRQGVISLVDLGYDYYLVTFTNKEDHTAALIGGPWLIYDHYLAVREWSPNFNPAVESVKTIAVWVRFFGLPIEYYDAKVLHAIGDCIGRS
ncbi:hypothetical protein A2U01_0030030, partial [Trifolium medium]|nr:hypothetical protein [Trifolium medium]